jgi:putative FmdB family regulatory protein
MPLYEYKCAKCGEVFELIQKFSDEPLHEHPGCGGAVEKLLSAAALQFKGSGWYVTDYGRNGSSGKESSGKDSGGKDKEKSKADSGDGRKSSESNKSEKAETSKPAAAPAQQTSTSTKNTAKSE